MEETKQLIDYLCAKLGTTAEYLIPEFARYRIGYLASEVGIAILAIIIGILLFRHGGIEYHKNEDVDATDAAIPYWVFGGIIAAVGFIMSLILVPELVGYICSPTAGALQDIMKMIQ